MLQRVYKMRCLAVLGCFWRLWSELEENIRLYCKIRHLERQNDFWTKNAYNIFFIQNLKILDRCAVAHCKIGSRRSTATSYKVKMLRKYLTLKNPGFFFFFLLLLLLKVLKAYVFYPNHRMLNSYTFVLSRIKIKNVFSTINKWKNLCIPYTARKNKIFIKKSQKYSFLA